MNCIQYLLFLHFMKDLSESKYCFQQFDHFTEVAKRQNIVGLCPCESIFFLVGQHFYLTGRNFFSCG